jgi:hypothetical protein
MTPTPEWLSLIMEGLTGKKRKKEGEALVESFLSEFREAEVKISHRGRLGNHYRLEYGAAGVEVSLHGSGMDEREGWWSVGVNFINTVEKWGGHWVVVLLNPEKRFLIDGCNFFRIAGDEDKNGRRHVQLANLEKSLSSAIHFSSVSEFLSISGLK